MTNHKSMKKAGFKTISSKTGNSTEKRAVFWVGIGDPKWVADRQGDPTISEGQGNQMLAHKPRKPLRIRVHSIVKQGENRVLMGPALAFLLHGSVRVQRTKSGINILLYGYARFFILLGI